MQLESYTYLFWIDYVTVWHRSSQDLHYTLVYHWISSSSVVILKHPSWSRRVRGSKPIWDYDFFPRSHSMQLVIKLFICSVCKLKMNRIKCVIMALYGKQSNQGTINVDRTTNIIESKFVWIKLDDSATYKLGLIFIREFSVSKVKHIKGIKTVFTKQALRIAPTESAKLLLLPSKMQICVTLAPPPPMLYIYLEEYFAMNKQRSKRALYKYWDTHIARNKLRSCRSNLLLHFCLLPESLRFYILSENHIAESESNRPSIFHISKVRCAKTLKEGLSNIIKAPPNII